jgi:geranylgeranyl diphosphate synthase type I
MRLSQKEPSKPLVGSAARPCLEWWFVHGAYAPPGRTLSHFMVAVFKQDFFSTNGKKAGGFSRIEACLNGETGVVHTDCLIDRSLLNVARRIRRDQIDLNADPRLVQAFLEELQTNGAPREVRLSSEKAVFRPSPLRLDWDGFNLQQRKDGFRLSFAFPNGGGRSDLHLVPEYDGFDVKPAEPAGTILAEMNYRTYPRLVLRGTVGGKPVSGTAWLDHQWGHYDWLIANAAGGRVLGWNWFGLNLDDGSDWVIVEHLDGQSRSVLSRYAVVRDSGGRIRSARDFSCVPGRFWESPRTTIRHPVEWTLDFPDLGGCLRFKPVRDEQEVPVFGLARAIWEGAGTVEGRFQGRRVSGRGRGEFLGYGYLFKLADLVESFGPRIDRNLSAFFPRTMTRAALRSYTGENRDSLPPRIITEMLSRPVWDLLDRKGKRWRPIFGLILLDALGRDTAPYERLISVMAELPHSGALIIDDIEDASLLRRGRECIHLRFGQDVAINAANAVYFLPTLLNFSHLQLNDAQKLQIQDIIMTQFVRAHLGQAMDLFWSRNMTPAGLERWLAGPFEARIVRMYELKTAAFVEGLAKIIAILADAPPDLGRACAVFARRFGTAFQIVDDILNYSRSADWRKTAREDLEGRKMTLVLCRALRRLRPSERRRLAQIVGAARGESGPAETEEAASLIRKSGAMNECRETARKMLETAWASFSRRLEPSQPKIMLKTLSQNLIDLDFDS